MDEQKKKSAGAPDADAEVDNKALHEELEDLAKVFQEELNNAKADAQAEDTAAASEFLIQELDDMPKAAQDDLPQEEIEPEALCECCGEQRRGTAKNPDSAFCEECDDGLRHYPFEWVNIILALAAVAFVFFGGYVFADHTPVFVAAKEADALVQEKKMDSALDAYAKAANLMIDNHINGELVYKREILVAYTVGYVNSLSEPAANIHGFEMSLPHFRSLKKALDDAENFMAAAQAVSNIISPYGYTAAADIPYDDLIAEIDKLKTATVTTTQAADGEEEATTTAINTYKTSATQYHPGMLAFYKYYVALMCEKDIQTQLTWLEEVRKEAPEHPWLYAAALGELYAKTGGDVESMCTLISDINAEDGTPTQLRALRLRVQGDYDASIALCEEGIAAGSEVSVELYRQESLCYLGKGDPQKAYEQANAAYQSGSLSVQLCQTLALCASAAGQDAAYTEIEELLTTNGYSVSAEVTGYRNGTLTLQQILTEGDYDVL